MKNANSQRCRYLWLLAFRIKLGDCASINSTCGGEYDVAFFEACIGACLSSASEPYTILN